MPGCAGRALQGLPAGRADRVPGPRQQPRPADAGRATSATAARRLRSRTGRGAAAGEARVAARRRCSPRSGWTRTSRPGTRTSCPAGSASGSRSPGRSASSPACWSWTSRPARSTSGAGADPRPDRPAARRAPARLPADHPQPRDRQRAVRADRVLYLGRVAESGPTGELLSPRPRTPTPGRCARPCPSSTRPPAGPGSCCTASPRRDQARRRAASFHPRCPLAIDVCRTEVPPLQAVAPGRLAACHRAEEVLAGLRPPGAPAQLTEDPGRL